MKHIITKKYKYIIARDGIAYKGGYERVAVCNSFDEAIEYLRTANIESVDHVEIVLSEFILIDIPKLKENE